MQHLKKMPKPEEVFQQLRDGKLSFGEIFAPRMLSMKWAVNSGWSKPKIHNYEPIRLAPSASVFHYGMEIFEGLKVFRKDAHINIFRPQLNIARLNTSAIRMALPTIDEEKMLNLIKAFVWDVREWVPDVDTGSLYLRPVLLATDERIGVRRSDTALLYIIASPVCGFFQKEKGSFLEGVRLKATPDYIRAWPGGMGFCKTGGNYAISMAPAENAKKEGFDQILWLSDAKEKRVTEVGMMNVFFVMQSETGKKLLTPRLDGTILDGVTRRSVLQLGKEMGIVTEERDVFLDEVFEGVSNGSITEIFGSGTAALICPVASLQCEDRIASLSRREQPGHLSVRIREGLIEIQASNDHSWMVPVRNDPIPADAIEIVSK